MVTAEYQGRVVTVDATARRNTSVGGSVRWLDLNRPAAPQGSSGPGSIGYIDAYVNGLLVGSNAGSDYAGYGLLGVTLRTAVAPGVHDLHMLVGIWCGGGRTTPNASMRTGAYDLEPGSAIDILDSDTQEVLLTLPLDSRPITVAGVGCPTGEVDWPITIPAFID